MLLTHTDGWSCMGWLIRVRAAHTHTVWDASIATHPMSVLVSVWRAHTRVWAKHLRETKYPYYF